MATNNSQFVNQFVNLFVTSFIPTNEEQYENLFSYCPSAVGTKRVALYLIS